MRRFLPACALALALGVVTTGAVSAWWPCSPPVTWQYQTATCYRTEYRTEYREVERTVYRCVPETKQRTITETFMVPETKLEERKYQVLVSDWKKEERKEKVMVPEVKLEERERTFTTFKRVPELQKRQVVCNVPVSVPVCDPCSGLMRYVCQMAP